MTTRIVFAIGARVRHRPSGVVGTIERPVYPDQWWVSWREGPLTRRAMYRDADLELATMAVEPLRDQVATPPKVEGGT